MEHDLQSIEYLYDFIYVDAKRISSYLAQLDPNGALTGIKLTASDSTTLAADGTVKAVVASGTLKGTSASAEGKERQFDPTWTLPVTIMDRLDELGFIHRSLTTTPIGQLFLKSGHVQILDIRMIKELWPLIMAQHKKELEAQQAAEIERQKSELNRNQRRAINKITSGQKANNDDVADDQSALLKQLPHSLQMHFLTNEAMLWSTLNPDYMVVSPEDFALKHGSVIPGEWHILAIVDSFQVVIDSTGWKELPMNQLAQGLMDFTEIIRSQFGRPLDSVAVTPLAIFRSIKTQEAIAGEAAPPPDETESSGDPEN